MNDLDIKFYIKTGDAWEAMLADLRTAEKSIEIEQYIFAIDTIGKKFLNILIEKAKAGVKIRLLADTVGSYTFYRSPIPEELRRIGIEIRFFNPIKPWRITNFTSNFFRDHRKIMVIDNVVGHIGGVGIQEHMQNWRDTHMRLTGPIVSDMRDTFYTAWKNIAKKSFLIKFHQPQQFVKNTALITNSPSIKQRHIYHALVDHIRNAKRYIYLTTPYFIPDTRLFRVLRLASKRGVDVRIILPEVVDHIFIDHARESYFTIAMKAGIKIYSYYPEMMHTKAAVIDDWATAGSYNLDNLSALFNHEANLASTDPQFVEELRRQFLDDLERSRRVHYEIWIERPLIKKILELVTWPFHNIM